MLDEDCGPHCVSALKPVLSLYRLDILQCIGYGFVLYLRLRRLLGLHADARVRRWLGLTESHVPLPCLLHRWGDGPLRWLQCILFLHLEREVHQFTDFEYSHYDDTFNKKLICRGCATARVVG